MDYYRNYESSSDNSRNKCAACFRQFNKMEHLVEHMRTSYHSVHVCGICKKHCRSFESLREHLIGPLPKQECKNIFSSRGCEFCLTILDSPNARYEQVGLSMKKGKAEETSSTVKERRKWAWPMAGVEAAEKKTVEEKMLAKKALTKKKPKAGKKLMREGGGQQFIYYHFSGDEWFVLF